MRTLSVLAVVATIVLAAPLAAEDKEKELTGTYTRKADQLDLKMVFKKDKVMEFHIVIGEASAIMTSKYTREKDGTLKCEVTDFEKKGDFPVTREKGSKFSFKWEPTDKKGKLSELMGDDISDEAKQSVEGEYESKTD